MSYILDALKKSDQQRQRGTTPTLLTSQTAVVALKPPAYLFYAVLAAILVSAGIAIGWLRPWQPEQALPEAKPVPAQPAVAHSQPSDPLPQPELVELPQQAKPEIPLPKSQPSDPLVATQNRPAMKQDMPAPSIPGTVVPASRMEATPVAEKAAPADISPEQQGVRTMAQLPASIQQEIPKISISGLVYSDDSQGRLVGINDQLLREGEYPAPGLKLEQITPDGVIFSYKKYRFRRDAQ